MTSSNAPNAPRAPARKTGAIRCGGSPTPLGIKTTDLERFDAVVHLAGMP